jgi:predicted nucleic acid-binding protein
MLADTSVWVQHFRYGSPGLAAALRRAEVECHPFVIGELACGHLAKRDEILALLAALPSVPPAEHEEVLRLVEAEKLMGRGIGWVDAHLLCSVRLGSTRLWTLDRRLAGVAQALGVRFEP